MRFSLGPFQKGVMCRRHTPSTFLPPIFFEKFKRADVVLRAFFENICRND